MGKDRTDMIDAFLSRKQEIADFFRGFEDHPERHSVDELLPYVWTFHGDRALILMNRMNPEAAFEQTSNYINLGAHSIPCQDIERKTRHYKRKRCTRTTIDIFSDYMKNLKDHLGHVNRFRRNDHTTLFVDTCYDLARQR